jgi:hypothetical protein
MPLREKPESIGEWAFIGGLLLAVLAGIPEIFAPGLLGASLIAVVLLTLGLLVGLLNVTARETTDFLVAAIGLLLVGSAGIGGLPLVGPLVSQMTTNIATFVAPAVFIVAIKAVYEIASRR